MENEKLLEKINTACNILDSLRAELINEDRGIKKAGKKKKEDVTKTLAEEGELEQEFLIKQTLEQYSQPTDDEHVENVSKIIKSNNITLEQLARCLQRVNTANAKTPIRDIKKYTYGSLHAINRQS